MIAFDGTDCTSADQVQWIDVLPESDSTVTSNVSWTVIVPELEPLPPRLGWHDCHRIPRELGAEGLPPRAPARAGRRGGERGLGVRNFARVA